MRRVLLLCALLGGATVAASVGWISVGNTRSQLEVIEHCAAARTRRAPQALAWLEARIADDPAGRLALECRCETWLADGDFEACTGPLDGLVHEDGWLPGPALSALLIQTRREQGRGEEAAALARAAGRAYPESPPIFRLELDARAAFEDEDALLEELAARVPESGEVAARMRVALAQRRLMRGDPPSALVALGAEPPEAAGDARGLWFDTLGIAHAMNDDLEATRASYGRWERAGGRPAEVRARYALALSIAGLDDPSLDLLRALRTSLAEVASLELPALEESLAIRLIFTLVASGRSDDALAAYDALAGSLALEGVRREDLERAQRSARLAAAPNAPRRGTLRFTLEAEAPSGAVLWVSPDADAEPDALYDAHPIAPGGALEIERRETQAPQRWVLRGPTERTLASGTLYPRPGETREVAIRLAEPRAPLRFIEPKPVPGDGRRRVAMLLLDCGDWPISRYLLTRGELPVFESLLREGYRAVLDSDPPLTAAALDALVWPLRRSDASTAGTFYRFGVELAGLESVGRNPFELLSWVLPESRDFFAEIGAGERRAANLLLAHGGVRAGRHGVVSGPDGAVESLGLGPTLRVLDDRERRDFPDLAGLGRPIDTHYVRTIAAEFDSVEQLLRESEIDLIAARIEPLDILTHAHFADAVRDRQDDGRGLLFELYRYIDSRIGQLRAQLDGDDVLIVFSDHGIRSAMQHARPAIFVAHGAGVPHGRAEGRPALRGVSRVVADLLGVETRWPDTGVGWQRQSADLTR